MAEKNYFDRYDNEPKRPVPVSTIRPIIIGESPEEAAARRAEEARQQQAAGFAAESAGKSQREEIRGAANQLRDEFNAIEPVTSYKKALPNYVAALKTQDTGTGDLALVYYFAKTIDPGSAVQQGEMDNIQTTDARLPAFAQNALRELRLSNGKFTDEAREGLRRELRGIVEQRKAAYLDERDRYMELAKSPEYNVNPNIVVGATPFGERYNEEIQSYWKAKEEVDRARAGARPVDGRIPVNVVPEQTGKPTQTEFDLAAQNALQSAWNRGASADEIAQIAAQYNQSITPEDLQWFRDNPGKPRSFYVTPTVKAISEPAPSFYESLVGAVTGEDRATPTTEALSDWTQLPELTQLSNLVDPGAWQTAIATALGGSPTEIAQIVQENFPGIRVRQDEKGNLIFRSSIDNRDYAIKPGFQLSDIPRAGAQVVAGLIGGGGRTLLGTAGREAAVQTGIETLQAGAGGTFNPADIAAAGVLGAAGQKIADVTPAAIQRLRGMRGGDGGGMPPTGLAGGMPSGGLAAPSTAQKGVPVTPMAPAAGMAPEAPTMGAEAPRTFEAGETVTSRAGGAMGTSPESVRVMQAEGLPVPVQLTQGAATRDPEQLAFEKEQLFSELGGPLRRRAEENNLQALQNFDRFIDMTGGEAPDISSTGNAVINALSKGYQAAKNRVRVAYKAADNAGETAELVSYAPIVDFINGQTATTRTTLAPILQSTLEKIRLEDPTNSGQISIRAMEDIRKTINKAAQPGTPNEVYGGSVKDIIDDVTEGVGGDLYKKARQLRIDQANKFEKRAVVSRFVSNIKNMDDRRVPADRVFQSAILNEAPENIQYLKKTLKELGDDGRQAWSELQAATLRHIQEQATKNVNMTSDNLPVVSVAQLNKVVTELDKNGRLDLIFNPKMAQQVRDLRDVMQYVNTVPPGTSINNSGTARTLLTLLSESGATAWMTGGIPVPVLTGIKVIRDQIKDAGIKRKINRSLLPRSERD